MSACEYSSCFVIIADEVWNDNLRPRQILPDTWWTFRRSIAEYKLMRRQKLLISCHRDLSGNRCYHKMMIVRSTIRNVYVVIWINPSITCLAPETFVHKRVHINHWDYKNISSYVIILYILYIYILTKNIKQ